MEVEHVELCCDVPPVFGLSRKKLRRRNQTKSGYFSSNKLEIAQFHKREVQEKQTGEKTGEVEEECSHECLMDGDVAETRDLRSEEPDKSQRKT
ncbi:hypothetical protein RUM44_008525 [Polyplax serrata]|uniref:Uncharacterized protein n=1 Tax=Polyplax serrata TaxID=468196 RepID=A0ABR1BAM2_POLSC